MHAFAIIVALVSVVAAARPEKNMIGHSVGPRDVLSKMTVSEADAHCSNDQQLACCNSTVEGDDVSRADGVLSGVLNGALDNGLSLVSECSKIDVAVLIGVQNILNDQCTSNVACCQQSDVDAETGVINAAVGCVGIGQLIG